MFIHIDNRCGDINRIVITIELEQILLHILMWKIERLLLVLAKFKLNNLASSRNNLISKNSELVVISGMRKDHKPITDPATGPPSRLLCSGNVGYNARFSNLLCLLLEDITNKETTECENTEDLIASMEEINTIGINEDFVLGSMDVAALYPSLDIDHTTEIVCQQFMESDTKITGVNYVEVILYIALNKTKEEIEELGLTEKCPKRKYKKGPRPNMTECGAKDRPEGYEPWEIPDTTNYTENERRQLITIALGIALKIIMKNHIYKFDKEIRRQKEGGAIGLELTGQLAKIYMIWWDKQYIRKTNELGLTLMLYKRYVDDITNRMKFPGYGCCIKDGKIEID